MVGPLAGFTVGLTGDRRWEELAEMVTRRGAQVVHGPVMRTGLLDDADVTRAATEVAVAAPVDVVVLTTGIGTRSWFGVAESAGLDDRLREVASGATVVARGAKARSAGMGNGLAVAWSAPGETSAELLVHLRDQGVAGRRIVVQRDGGAPVLAEALIALGAEVIDVPVYRWTRPDDDGPARRLLDAAVAGRLHAVLFTCAYGVGAAFELAPDPNALRRAFAGGVLAVAVGPVTAAALRCHGVTDVVEPARARLGAMVQALVAALGERQWIVRLGPYRARWQGLLVAHGDGTTATLTAGEARVLAELLRRAPAVVSKTDLVEDGSDAHAAEVAVARLRTKLGPLAAGVRTVPRRGYVSELEVVPDRGTGDDLAVRTLG